TFAYDLVGRLTDVSQDGTDIAHYTYDANGNRLSTTGPGGTLNGTYDAQDRLTTYGNTTYTYTGAGQLESGTTSGQTTTYTYDALGSLIKVALPGKQVSYVVDGLGRRVGKEVNGTLVQGFLYQDSLRPVAELDGQGHVVTRFV